MKTLFQKSPVLERGSVECAVVLFLFLIMLSGMLFFGRLCWHYTVLQKAAHDAGRFLATTSLREIVTSTGGDVPVALVARQIVLDETAELNPGGLKYTPVIQCFVGADWDACDGAQIPKRVKVRAKAEFSDPFLDAYTSVYTDGDSILLQAVMATDWVGN
jgi:Flp pilus assembly protein TadG